MEQARQHSCKEGEIVSPKEATNRKGCAKKMNQLWKYGSNIDEKSAVKKSE